MMMLGIPAEKPFPSTSENKKNTLMVIQDWMLGPEQPSNERGANGEYWRGLAKAMQVDEAEVRRRRCSNCEYYDNTPDTQLKMERIPWNQWDVGAGFRGFCTKFSFVCHDLRSCQAWEEKEFEGD
jgi:hypothetical protein